MLYRLYGYMYWQQYNAGCRFSNIIGKENVLVSDTLLTYAKKLIMRITAAYPINKVERVSLSHHRIVLGLTVTVTLNIIFSDETVYANK